MIIVSVPAERVFLRRLIRSLKDRHSMIPSRLIQLGLQAILKKEESLFFVLIEENSCEFQSLL
jgi:hypothetical protein